MIRLTGPGGIEGEFECDQLEQIFRVHAASMRCHELVRQGHAEAAELADLVSRAGQGDAEAAGLLGFTPTRSEVDLVTAQVDADLALLAPGDERDLAEPPGAAPAAKGPAKGPLLRTLPYPVAEALRWLAWHESWVAAVGRMPEMHEPGQPSPREEDAEKARAAWAEACGAHGRGDVSELLAGAARAAAGHAASKCAAPKRSAQQAADQLQAFEDSLRALEEASPLHEDLRESVRQLLWNAAWHAAGSVPYQDEEGEQEEEQDEAEEAEEEEEEDPFSRLAHFLTHSLELHRGSPDQHLLWRGLCFPSCPSATTIFSVAKAGFNALRVPVEAPPAGGPAAIDGALADLSACCVTAVDVVVDLSGWPLLDDGDREAHHKSFAAVAGAAARATWGARVRGVVLPRVALSAAALTAALSVAKVLRSGGLPASTCAVILPMADPPEEEEDEEEDGGGYASALRRALGEGAPGLALAELLVADGHIVFETDHRPPEDAETLYDVLEYARHAGDDAHNALPPSCARWSLGAPEALAETCRALGDRWWEELAAAGEAGCSEATHGWFAALDAKDLASCLSRRWGWPDPMADRVLWPHEAPHTASLVFLHGFTCTGKDYLSYADYFCRELAAPGNINPEEVDEEGDEEEGGGFEPYPGLKVVLPTAPLQACTCYDGDLIRSWHDYLTDNDGKQEDEIDDPGVEASVKRIHALLDAEVASLGGPERVFLGGSSQGSGLALHAAMTYRRDIGGVLACQGHVLKQSRTLGFAGWAARGIPVRAYNGLADTTMAWEDWVSATYDPLRASGGDVEFTLDEGVDHADDEAEGRWVRSFLSSMLGA